MHRFATYLFMAGSIVAIAGARAEAQYDAIPDAGPGTISSRGRAVVRRKPESMRMQLVLTAKGKTIQDAMTQLAERQKSAKEALLKLGASESAVSIGEPGIGAGQNDQDAQMRQMVMSRLKSTRKDGAKAKSAEVSVTIKAEFVLKGTSMAEIVSEAYDLQERIRAADLAGAKAAKANEDDDEEEEAEASGPEQMFFNQYQKAGQKQAGEPEFTFVSRVPDEARAQALKDAFARGKADAERLAAAAGAKLGPLRSMNASMPDMNDPYNYARMYGRASKSDAELDGAEASSSLLGELSYQVTVSMSFELQRDGPQR